MSAAPHPGGEGPAQGERHRERPGGGAVVPDRPAHVSRRPPGGWGRHATATRCVFFSPHVSLFSSCRFILF